MANANSTCLELAAAGVVCYGVFFNYENSTQNTYGVDCTSSANFDADITGIGVVISFGLSAIITTAASIAACLLDYFAGEEQYLLPSRWQPENISPDWKEAYKFYRRIVDRLILNFADQQLVTGFALLICAWVKLHANPVLQGAKLGYQARFPNTWLPNAQFALVVFLGMASSSSHLACVLVLRDYMQKHQSAARLRFALIVVFSAFLATTVALASSLTPYFAWIILKPILLIIYTEAKGPPDWVSVLIVALTIAIPLFVILVVFWLCALQLMPGFKRTMREKIRTVLLYRIKKWFKISKIWHSCLMRLLPLKWRKPFTKFVKRTFWFMMLGNELVVFILQILLAIISIVWIGLQRLAIPPTYYRTYDPRPTPLCSLHHVAPSGAWASFGQLLPLILLLLPVISAYGMIIEERDEKRKSSGYGPISSGEVSPLLNRRHSSRNALQPNYGDDSELALLSPRSRRHESDVSPGSSFGRVHYGRHESQNSLTGLGVNPYGYGETPTPIFSLDSQQWYLGWPRQRESRSSGMGGE